MFRKTLLVSIAALILNVASAQITIVQSDMPAVGDTVRISLANQNVSALINRSGIDQVWDASSLIANFQDVVRFRTPTSINFTFGLTFTNSTYGTESQAPAFGNFGQGSDGYEFYRNSSANFIRTGRAFSFPNVPLPLTQTYADTVYRFPLAYGNKDSCQWVSSEVNALVATIRSTGKRVNEVDGWGSIVTPFGTYDCIRVKSTLRTTDTVRTQFLPIPFPVTQNITEYKWFAVGQKLPILEITSTAGGVPQPTITIKYRDINRPDVFNNLARFNVNRRTFAVNATTDTCTLTDVSTRNPTSRVWTITPNTFRFVGGTDANSQRAQVIFEAEGTYTVSLRVNYRGGSDDTTAVDLITVADGPKAGFTADRFGGNPNDIIQFTDTSSGNPTAYEWSFLPATVSFVGGTSASAQNPRVLFDQPGIYNVSLRVENAVGEDQITRQGYISIFPTGVSDLHNQKQFLVFPNPVKDILQLQSQEPIQRVVIYSLDGRLVHEQVVEQSQFLMHVNNIPNGLYMLKLIHHSGSTGLVKLEVAH